MTTSIKQRKRRVLTTADAQAALEAAEAAAAQWATEAASRRHEAERLAAELAVLESTAAQQLLDSAADDDGEYEDDEPVELIDPAALERMAAEVIQKRTEQDLAARAAAAAADRVAQAQRAVLKSRAAQIRARAGELRAVAEWRTGVTNALLQQLRDWESAPYQPQGVAPRTVAAGQRAQTLDAAAAKVDDVAVNGTDDQVVYQLGLPMPEVTSVEAAVLASRNTHGDVQVAPQPVQGPAEGEVR